MSARHFIALAFAGDTHWEVTLPIPRAADAITASIRATRALAQGEPVRFLLHNHGQNTWLPTSLTVHPR